MKKLVDDLKNVVSHISQGNNTTTYRVCQFKCFTDE